MALDGFDLAVPAGGVDGLLGPNGAGQLLAVAFPLGMVSSVFTPPSLRPSWLGAIAMWNPVSSALAVRRFHRQRR